MIIRRRGLLHGKEDQLMKDLKKTTLSFEKLGERYGVSKQAIHRFYKKQGIKRPVRIKKHQTKGCLFCQKLIQISKKPHSEFISTHTIMKEAGGSTARYRRHLRILRDMELVSRRFGKLRSKRLEEAYAIYFKERLPIHAIGRRVGLKNFHAILRQHRKLGYDVPPSLYVYDGRERSRIWGKIQQRKHR